MIKINFRHQFTIKKKQKEISIIERNSDQVCFLARIENLEKIKKKIPSKKQHFQHIKSFDHPNLLKMSNWYCDQTFSYELFEYCQKNLLQVLNQKTLPEQEVNSAVLQLAKGLEYLHSKGYIVRLLPLQSIFMNRINKDQYVYKIGMLTSLRLQVQISHTIVSQPMFDTNHYKGYYHAPELLQSNRFIQKTPEDEIDDITKIEKVGCHTDIFCLGVIFFEMLTGECLFPDTKVILNLKNIPFKDYVRATFPQTQIKLRLLNWIARMLEFDFKKRITIKQFIKQIDDGKFYHLTKEAKKQQFKKLQNQPNCIKYRKMTLFYDLTQLVSNSSISEPAKNFALNEFYKIFCLHLLYLEPYKLLPQEIKSLYDLCLVKIQNFKSKVAEPEYQKYAKEIQLNWVYQQPQMLAGSRLQDIKQNQLALFMPYKNCSSEPRMGLALMIAMTFRKNVLKNVIPVKQMYESGSLVRFTKEGGIENIKTLSRNIEQQFFV